MITAVAVWAASRRSFETSVPLVEHLHYARAHSIGSSSIHACFLDGFDTLGDAYKGSLQDAGYTLHDMGETYRSYALRFSSLSRFGDYEMKCFLRWLVLDDCFGHAPLLHIDGDVVLCESPESLMKRFVGLTFVLQGCPAFTHVEDASWFTEYREALSIFEEDIEPYSRTAYELLPNAELAKGNWLGFRDRKIISSDQDLIRHLLSISALPQATAEEIRNRIGDDIMFENPLWPLTYYDDLAPVSYERKSGFDYLNDKKVLMWHFQSGFCEYLNRVMWMRRYLPCRAAKPVPLTPSAIERRYRRLTTWAGYRPLDRNELYRRFLLDGDFSPVFNRSTWWQEGVFA